MSALLALAVLAPLVAFAVLGVSLWFGLVWTERATAAAVVGSCALSAVATASVVVALWAGPESLAISPVGTWFGHADEAFHLRLLGDALSLPFALLGSVLCGLIGVFARRYLHRDPGYHRFYLLLALFVAGVELVVLAGALELLVVGWELAGLTSALLIAFFHHRRGPVAHGLRAFATYRLCDIGLLAALAILHHSAGTDIGAATPTGPVVVAIGLLLLIGSMGKAAQFPFSGWLPRAMEGPTPSSAIFYGAISVSLGPYLLLRTEEVWGQSTVVRVAVVLVGVVTAGYATLVGRVQTDVKSALAFASMGQVALVYIEVGAGLRLLAVIHLIAHALLRSAQLLRSPSLLHDHHHLEQATGAPLPPTGRHYERLLPTTTRRRLYRTALERGYIDGWLVDRVLTGVTRALHHASERGTR